MLKLVTVSTAGMDGGQRRTKKKKLAAGESSLESKRWPLIRVKQDPLVNRLKGDHLFTVSLLSKFAPDLTFDFLNWEARISRAGAVG